MIDVKEAAKVAYDYFAELYQGKYHNLAVEEAEITDDEKFWIITLGYDVQGQQTIMAGPSSREYKVLKIEAEAGRVVQMKMRKG
jgi:hypothetical protein